MPITTHMKTMQATTSFKSAMSLPLLTICVSP